MKGEIGTYFLYADKNKTKLIATFESSADKKLMEEFLRLNSNRFDLEKFKKFLKCHTAAKEK